MVEKKKRLEMASILPGSRGFFFGAVARLGPKIRALVGSTQLPGPAEVLAAQLRCWSRGLPGNLMGFSLKPRSNNNVVFFNLSFLIF